MSWLPKGEELDPKQASAVDFAVAQSGNFSVSGVVGARKSVVIGMASIIAPYPMLIAEVTPDGSSSSFLLHCGMPWSK